MYTQSAHGKRYTSQSDGLEVLVRSTVGCYRALLAIGQEHEAKQPMQGTSGHRRVHEPKHEPKQPSHLRTGKVVQELHKGVPAINGTIARSQLHHKLSKIIHMYYNTEGCHNAQCEPCPNSLPISKGLP